MFEHHKEHLLPRPLFLRRLGKHAIMGLATLAGALGLGMIGYHHFEGDNLVDSFANASMILSGMGPLGELKTTGGKIFAGCYALFSGVVFLTTIGIFLAPIVHRLFHKFHLAAEKADKPVPPK